MALGGAMRFAGMVSGGSSEAGPTVLFARAPDRDAEDRLVDHEMHRPVLGLGLDVGLVQLNTHQIRQ